ncbi:MAG TPA: energy transducer TonB [Gemmatimonadaceae bacterium]|nr:energy transducer TonB [Gemmatimonadaceae bacterium]
MPATRYLALLALLAACVTQDSAQKSIEALTGGPRPDTLPRMLNGEPPFRYPPSLYEQRVQGNVTLRIYIDTAGRLMPESTSVAETSGYPGLDSAAVRGAEELRFAPAKKGDRPMAVSILLPVYFRHPEAAALPGDTVLKTQPTARQPEQQR